METFSALLAICAGNSPVPVNSTHKGQWRGPLMFSLICVWINGWVNNGETGDLRRYRAHYDVTVMIYASVNQAIIGSNKDSEPRHCGKQCWPVVDWSYGNTFQWNSKRNTKNSFQLNAFKCIICKIAAILFRPQCFKGPLVTVGQRKKVTAVTGSKRHKFGPNTHSSRGWNRAIFGLYNGWD